jgi:hypothetical protein
MRKALKIQAVEEVIQDDKNKWHLYLRNCLFKTDPKSFGLQTRRTNLCWMTEKTTGG